MEVQDDAHVLEIISRGRRQEREEENKNKKKNYDQARNE